MLSRPVLKSILVVAIRIFLSFCLFSYNGVYLDVLKLSVSDVIVSLKSFNGDRKLQFFGRD